MSIWKPTRKLLAAIKNLRWYDQRLLHQLWEERHLARVFARFGVDCVFDVGANYGQYATMLRRKVGFEGLICSFEPIPAAAAALRERARADKRWIVEEVALAATDGHATFNVMRSSQFSSLSEARHDDTGRFRDENSVSEVITVRSESLGSAFARLQAAHGFARPFLKLDTQGFDVRIVEGGRAVMDRFVGLQSELAIKKLYADSVDFRRAIDVYEGCGFELSAFVPNNEGHFPQLMETDCIMVRLDTKPSASAA
jgi:FkbM family methyltransferase